MEAMVLTSGHRYLGFIGKPLTGAAKLLVLLLRTVAHRAGRKIKP
jgi:hypothetical protein